MLYGLVAIFGNPDALTNVSAGGHAALLDIGASFGKDCVEYKFIGLLNESLVHRELLVEVV